MCEGVCGGGVRGGEVERMQTKINGVDMIRKSLSSDVIHI